MAEDRATRIKRLRMRSMRRGIKEMDLILSAYADGHLANHDDNGLATYDALLSESDLDIYSWITGQGQPPARFAPLIDAIKITAQGIVRPT